MDKIKSSMQSEATILANNSQHCWMLHVIFVSGGVWTPCYMFLRVVACRCVLLLRVPACCCVSLPVAPARSCVLLGVIAQSLKPVKLLIQRLPPFLFFFFFVHDCWSGVFLRVAETIADSLLCLRCGYCSASFQSFVLRLLYYHMGNFCKLIGLEQ